MAAPDSRTRLLEATLDVVRAKGYTAARVEDICSAAGVTKGSFFHHFASKDELALAAAALWNERAHALFTSAPYNAAQDPLERLLGYLAFRKAMLAGELGEFTCYAGTVIQEAYVTHPDLRDACEAGIVRHTAWLGEIIDAAMRTHGMTGPWSALSLARHILAVLQGGFILAKGEGSGAVAADSVDHLIRYVELLFGTAKRAVRSAPAARSSK